MREIKGLHCWGMIEGSLQENHVKLKLHRYCVAFERSM